MNDASTGLPVTQIDHTVVRGVIAYTSKKPERMDQERGREFYTITKYGSGGRTIGVHTEIDDRPSVMRDATYTVDENWMPQDCFVRLTVGDAFMGTGWFKFFDTHTECETFHGPGGPGVATYGPQTRSAEIFPEPCHRL